MIAFINLSKHDLNLSTVVVSHARPHFFFGVGLESALDPERPFSVLSIPDEDTRHSLLQEGSEKKKKVALELQNHSNSKTNLQLEENNFRVCTAQTDMPPNSSVGM